jgi:hypothetical protein
MDRIFPNKKRVDDGVESFFHKLGYRVTWDCSRREASSWWEIMDDDGVIVQIDQGVPLTDIAEDLKCMYEGKPGTSKSDYKISGPNSARLKLLLKNVALGPVQAELPL